MPDNPRDELLKANARNMRFVDALDREMVRELVRVYEEARRDLLVGIQGRRALLGQVQPPRPGEEEGERERLLREALARDEALFRQIDARLAALRAQVAALSDDFFERSLAGAEQEARAEWMTLNDAFEVGAAFAMIDFTSIETGLELAMDALAADQVKLAALLKAELRGGLLRGDSVDDLVQLTLGQDSTLWARGRVSAELAVRRGIIEANNAARDLWYWQWKEVIPGLKKQAVAAISKDTTDTCLGVHGQIRDLDQPYTLTGRVKFMDEMMYPPFHWNCRTSSVAYHPDFERGSRLTTAGMVEAARAEREGRE